MYTPMRARLLAGLVTTGALLAACGGDDEATSPSTTEAAVEADTRADVGSFDDADIQFLHGMIPHHEDAISMAELVEGRTERPELLRLSEAVIASQEPEVEQMELLLEEAGEPSDGADGGHDMSEMMGEADMGALEGLTGVEFDLAFIDAMTVHHEGAITDAEEVLESGENPQVRALAEEIIAAQQAEIDQMAAWKAAWAPDAT